MSKREAATQMSHAQYYALTEALAQYEKRKLTLTELVTKLREDYRRIAQGIDYNLRDRSSPYRRA